MRLCLAYFELSVEMAECRFPSANPAAAEDLIA